MKQLEDMLTESRNPSSDNLDQLTAAEIVQLMNREDQSVADAVCRTAPQIAKTIEAVAERLSRGGRLFYIGAGTSGRLGVLDAAECPPTFSTPVGMVVGIIAGGSAALTSAIEGAEDDPAAAEYDLQSHSFTGSDVLIGIASSGRTPYVAGGLRYAKSLGAWTAVVTCNATGDLHPLADVVISPLVGPEIISGSTRLKAGTATKMVLNMISTGVMVLLGKTYGNFMVDLRATNSKLITRSLRMVETLTGCDTPTAQSTLRQCGGEVKTAIVSRLLGVDASEARRRLRANNGRLRETLAAGDDPRPIATACDE